MFATLLSQYQFSLLYPNRKVHSFKHTHHFFFFLIKIIIKAFLSTNFKDFLKMYKETKIKGM